MKSLIITLFIMAACINIFPQTWQPIGIPQGNGITDLVYWAGSAPFDNKIWATTGSVDWPTGQRGGVFYSDGNGVWTRLGGSAGYYVGRTLAVGQDGNLYASLWRDPALFPADALCRLSVQAATFGVLYQAQAGDNIFSIAVKNNPHTIFAGTRNGIIRSTNNGASFGYSNDGIPDSAWVYDIAIDSSGILAAASSKGVFVSTNNGDNWLTVTGISPEDTILSLSFISFSSFTKSQKSKLAGPSDFLYTGSHDGKLLRSFDSNYYTTFILVHLFADPDDKELDDVIELSRKIFMFANNRANENKISNERNISKINGNGSGVYESTDEGFSWNQINDGLPVNPPVSALALKVINETTAQLYAGLFNDTTNGAGVYRLGITVDVEEIDNEIPTEYFLSQNFPNPFNPSTTIQFSIPEQSFVKLEVFNSLGEKLSTLVSEELNAGNYKYDWNAENLSSGIYFYKLNSENYSEIKKMILLK